MRRPVPARGFTLLATGCLVVLLVGAAAAQTTTPPVPLAPPGDTGRRITDDGLFANYFPAPRKAPALLVLGGSVGGLSVDMNNAAKALQGEGFSVLHLSYHRAPGQNPNLELIPLESFATALTWLRRQPEVDASRMGILGGSKGAEAALLVAVRDPGLKAVIAALPSSVVWPGLIREPTGASIGSSWSERGKPVAPLPHVPYDPSKGGTYADNHAASLKGLPQHPEAAIPVERIAGRLLLVCGEEDQMWPSCPMARQIQQRLRDHGRPDATLLAYADVGHLAFGLPVSPDDPRLTNFGGTAAASNAARSDSWQKTIAFLKETLSLTTVAGLAQDPRVSVTFAPQDKSPRFDAATDEYRSIWSAEGGRIIAAMEQVTKLTFPEKHVKAEIYEGTSFSGRGGEPMRLRASYSASVKKGTLVHELGHRMNAQLKTRPVDVDEHRLLFLYLYDLWESLYGKEFADSEVAWERTLKGRYDYDAAWTWALAMTRDQRVARFGEVLRTNRK
jgi:uncharacterized protein